MSRPEDHTKRESSASHEWVLEGLDCANCALKIEHGVAKVKGVTSSSVNFVTKTLSLEVRSSEEAQAQVLADARKKIKTLEPHIKIVEKNGNSSHDALRGQGNSVNHTESAHGVGHAHHGHRHDYRDGHGVSHAHSAEHDHGHNHRDGHGNHARSENHAHGANDQAHSDHHGHDHGHDHGHSHTHGSNKLLLYRLIAGAVLFIFAIAAPLDHLLQLSLYIIAYLIVGGDIVWRALTNIARRQWFDEYFLMTIATLGAFAIGEYPEAVGVMLFYQVGEVFQGLAVNRSRKSISALLDIRPDYANLQVGNELRRVSPQQVGIGQHIVIKPGEKVPLDGVIVEGSSTVDTSALTGESMPREVETGNEILAGFINSSGLLTVETTKSYGESTVSKILELVQNASGKKAPTESFITKFARYYTPAVVFIAIALAAVPPLLFTTEAFSDWLYRALIFLVISCPCALVVSIPLGFFGGIGAASKHGILIKGGNYLEALNDVKYAVFDKTGTLTKGSFTVAGIYPASGVDEQQLLEYAAHAEQHSSHPIAASILAAYGKPLATEKLELNEEIAGHGVAIKWRGHHIMVGNSKLMKREGIAYAEGKAVGTQVHVAVDRQYYGYLHIADEVKDDAAAAIAQLKALGIKKTVMLTGDAKAVGEEVGKQLAVDEVYTELLPQHKVEHVESLNANKMPREKLVFIGDGINDTPVLAQADIGIAMGGLGSDAAIEAADIVIMTDEPSKVATAIRIARRTRHIVWQNIAFALGVKALFLLLGAFGIATMWEAVFSDVGVTLLAVLNAMRVLRWNGV